MRDYAIISIRAFTSLSLSYTDSYLALKLSDFILIELILFIYGSIPIPSFILVPLNILSDATYSHSHRPGAKSTQTNLN